MIRRIVNEVLVALDGEFAKIYADSGRLSTSPEVHHALAEAGVEVLAGPFLDFRDPWGKRFESGLGATLTSDELRITSDNLHLSEPTAQTASSGFAVDCNRVAIAPLGRIAVDCNKIGATEVECDDPEVLRFLGAATSTNTRRAYRTDVAHFIAWGGRIPSHPSTIARYLAHHASVLATATLARRLVGIGHLPFRLSRR